MKKILLMIILCLDVITIQAQVDFFYQSKYAGSFAVSQSKKSENASHIKIQGAFNKKDFAKLSNICQKNKQIKVIDLKGVTNINQIPDSAFINCTTLKKVILPNQISQIGNHAFYNCTDLKEISLGSNIVEVGEYGFYGCENLKEISFTHSLEIIKSNAFNGCFKLATITLPSTTVHLYDNCFKGCICLKSITCHAKTPPICEATAFSGCDLISCILYVNQENVEYYEDKAIWATFERTYPISDSKSEEYTLTRPNSTKISINVKRANGIKNCKLQLAKENHIIIRGVITKQDLKDLGERLRSDWKQIKTIELYHSFGTTTIPDFCFAECDSIKTVSISKRIKTIGKYSFYKCRNLQQINLPFTVESIGEKCFYQCENLKKFASPFRLKEIDAYAFSGCKQLTNIKLPHSIESIETQTFSQCEHLENIELPDRLKVIKRGAFMGCKTIETITIPDSVKLLGESAFEDCSKLKEIELPKNITTINSKSFWGCQSLKKVIIPDNVEEIGNWAFKNCDSLECVQLPNNLKHISDKAFNNCTNLNIIYILSETPPIIESDSFDETTKNNCKIIVPQNAENTYIMSENWWTFAKIKSESNPTK